MSAPSALRTGTVGRLALSIPGWGLQRLTGQGGRPPPNHFAPRSSESEGVLFRAQAAIHPPQSNPIISLPHFQANRQFLPAHHETSACPRNSQAQRTLLTLEVLLSPQDSWLPYWGHVSRLLHRKPVCIGERLHTHSSLLWCGTHAGRDPRSARWGWGGPSAARVTETFGLKLLLLHGIVVLKEMNPLLSSAVTSSPAPPAPASFLTAGKFTLSFWKQKRIPTHPPHPYTAKGAQERPSQALGAGRAS